RDFYVTPERVPVTYEDILSVIEEKISYYTQKEVAASRIMMEYVRSKLFEYMVENSIQPERTVSPEFEKFLTDLSSSNQHRTVAALATELRQLVAIAQYSPTRVQKQDLSGVTDTELIEWINSGQEHRLIIISFVEPQRLKRFAADISSRLLRLRKTRYTRHPLVLSVFDEAQEIIPRETRDDDSSRNSSFAVEQLLRQGRKYGLGGLIATQRLAYLNTNVLQQIHTYFVGTLPRPYDRTTISDQFAVDPSIVDRTLMLKPGEWLLSSYTATGVRSIPLFVSAPNNEHLISETFKSLPNA
ncbi:MAG: hypothetical protein QXI37_02275, partial [Thermoprotei archaeon]